MSHRVLASDAAPMGAGETVKVPFNTGEKLHPKVPTATIIGEKERIV